MHNELETTQDALQYFHEEISMARKSDLFNKLVLADFSKLVEEIRTGS